MARRRVIPSALINEGRIVIEGEDGERLPDSTQRYVSPSTGKAYSREKGDRIGDLPADAWEVPETTWFRSWLHRRSGESRKEKDIGSSSSLPSSLAETHDLEGLVNTLKRDCILMQQYFPSFDLMAENVGEQPGKGFSFESLIWSGSLDGIGEVNVRYGNQSVFHVSVGNLTEIDNTKMNEKIAREGSERRNPVNVLIDVMQYALAKKNEGPDGKLAREA